MSEQDGWKKARRGWSDIWLHPLVNGAIVDGRGYGLNPGVRRLGVEYKSVDEAKLAALVSP